MSTLPFFSIVVPTYGRPKELLACLESFVGLQYPRDRWEVVVVDDGSDQPLDHVAQRFRGRLSLTLHRQAHGGPARARNTGAELARGDYLAFTDDDCAPAPDWLTKLAARFAERPEHLLGGAVINALPDNPYSTASQLLASYLYTYYNRDHDRPRFFTSNNMALAKAQFFAAGGFDVELPRAAAEDRELCDRWLYLGRPMTYVPEAIVSHAHVLTLRRFWRQHFNYGCGAHYFHVTKARRGGGEIRVEPWSFYFNLLRYPYTSRQPRRRLRLASLLWLSQFANALGFFAERARERA